MPTIFHITHWKSGSQWIKSILSECVPNLIVEPKVGIAHFLIDPIQENMVYPTVYVTKEQFESVTMPFDNRKIVIIRDLRDTLISAYYSLKVSHPIVSIKMDSYRRTLNSLSMEDGLIYLIDTWLPASAAIQKTWLGSIDIVLKYETLIENDVDLLSKALLDNCELPVTRDKLIKVILGNRFNVIAGGRSPGNEDVTAHARKGVVGDWQNHFTEKVSIQFKSLYGELLILTGYESDMDW